MRRPASAPSRASIDGVRSEAAIGTATTSPARTIAAGGDGVPQREHRRAAALAAREQRQRERDQRRAPGRPRRASARAARRAPPKRLTRTTAPAGRERQPQREARAPPQATPTLTPPPCASAIARTVESPMPALPARSEPCANASKSRGSTAAVDAGAVVLDARARARARARRRARRAPRCAAWRMALSSRLSSACRSAARRRRRASRPRRACSRIALGARARPRRRRPHPRRSRARRPTTALDVQRERVRAAELEEVVDHQRQPRDLVLDRLQLCGARTRALALPQHGRVRPDHRQRIAQVVADLRDVEAALAIEVAQPVREMLERAGHATDLAATGDAARRRARRRRAGAQPRRSSRAACGGDGRRARRDARRRARARGRSERAPRPRSAAARGRGAAVRASTASTRSVPHPPLGDACRASSRDGPARRRDQGAASPPAPAPSIQARRVPGTLRHPPRAAAPAAAAPSVRVEARPGPRARRGRGCGRPRAGRSPRVPARRRPRLPPTGALRAAAGGAAA